MSDEKKQGQIDLFDGVEDETPVGQEEKQNRGRRQMEPLLPDRRRQRDFFLCDILDPTLKDDRASMEHPMFSLSTKPDTVIRRYEHNGNSIEIAPSVLGLATIKDKDILIYCVSQLVEAINRGREDVNRSVRITAYDLLKSTNRATGGREYRLLEAAFKRLKGTNITTDILTNGIRIKEGFGLIDRWKVIEKSPDDERMIAVEITLSEWLYNGVLGMEVLSISPDYFRLRKPLDRRLYELARKHCGKQTTWKVGLDLLRKKSGSTASLKEFRRHFTGRPDKGIKGLSETNHLPDYYVAYDEDRDQVSFWIREYSKLIKACVKCQGRELLKAIPANT